MAFQNSKIFPDFKIQSFQNHEFKISTDLKIVAFNNPEFQILAEFKILAFKILTARFWLI